MDEAISIPLSVSVICPSLFTSTYPFSLNFFICSLIVGFEYPISLAISTALTTPILFFSLRIVSKYISAASCITIYPPFLLKLFKYHYNQNNCKNQLFTIIYIFIKTDILRCPKKPFNPQAVSLSCLKVQYLLLMRYVKMMMWQVPKYPRFQVL